MKFSRNQTLYILLGKFFFFFFWGGGGGCIMVYHLILSHNESTTYIRLFKIMLNGANHRLNHCPMEKYWGNQYCVSSGKRLI